MDTTPISLLERVRRRSDQEAWSRFVQLYTPFIFSLAQKCGLQDEDAVDLTQDVFVSLVETLPKFIYDRHKSFRSWLRVVIVNRWRDRFKLVATRPFAGGADKLADLAVDDPIALLEDADYRQHLVARALALMKAEFQPTTWTACWEFVVNGRPAVQVAEQLGISENAVFIAKFRVLKRLKEELQGLIDE